MLRKSGNIITMLLLLISTTGFAVSEHFCGTDLVSIEINKEADNCCDSGMCCHSETQFFQLDDDFNFTASTFDFQTYVFTDLPQMTVFQQVDLYAVELNRDLYPDFESPPPPERQDFLSSFQTYLL